MEGQGYQAVLNKINKYFSHSKKYLLEKISLTKSSTSSNGLCCISITPQELILVYAYQVSGKPYIKLCESHSYKNIDSLFSTLTLIVKNNQLKNTTCALMLQPEDYQLLITDALPVSAAEFQAAIRWKIKDLIRTPMSDLVIDSFSMPKMKINQNKIMVVAAQLSKLKTMSDEIHDCGLNIKIIDIPELGLRNIINLYEQSDQATGLIYVQETSIQLLITSQHQIYVSRVLKFSLNTDNANLTSQSVDRLTGELQRSFDYYQSLWIPMTINYLFASTKNINDEAIELLSQKIKSPIKRINIMDVLACSSPLNLDQQGKFLPVIGEVLRENDEHATAN